MKLAKCIAFQDYKGVKSIIAGLFMTAAAGAIAGQSELKPLDWSSTLGMGKNLLAGSSIAAGDHYSAGDFYYWQGKRIPLYRSLTEYAVQFQEGLNKETQGAIIEAVSPLAKMTKKGKSRNQAVITLKTDKAEEPAAIEKIIDNLKARSDVRWAAPVYIHVKTGSRMLVTDEIVVKLKPGKDLASLAGLLQSYDLLLVKPMWGTQNEYVLRLQDPKAVNPLEAANALFESGLVEWAQPNFIQEYKRSFTSNDPRLSRQWHLTGTDNGTPTAHVRALKAWDITLGTPDITIAVIDDGVQIDHPDLAENIFNNPGEIPGNGVDDDGNGFIDDVRGWDFVNNDNDPSPFVLDKPDGDFHGTAVAGVAAAREDNGKGGSGVCPRCTILPVKIFNGKDGIDDAGQAEAIRYAARFADILNNSWGGGSPSDVVQSALQDAITQGRGGRGAVVLFAAGNSASGFILTRISSIPAGTHRFEWVYLKDSSDIFPMGRDTAWLGRVRFPGGELVNFESGMPAGWSTDGNAPWSIVNNARHADEGLCFTHAAKAGTITHDQSTRISVVKTVPAGDLDYYAEVSSEHSNTEGFDGLVFRLDLDNNATIDFSDELQSGLDPDLLGIQVVRRVGYPARYPEAIAIGASTDRDCRSSYSQFGPELDFVAPSSGGPLNREIFTTDLTGANGYNSNGNYTATFDGTSSATPLAAGIVGLVLSRNPNLTRKQVKQILRNTADKIGPAVYDEKGHNDRYGFGRLNANKAVRAARE
jgi:subtilisin family serine protease